ncbi:hypothetical protein PaecuDRAFT_0046 [Paenibacillus curdlanolyticus YK9]|uniref:Uncharacterized protein n=1 Tax=Paenibacillus curdlanolyticus YK9 TaxID=717606 RepID=E0I4K4_9BACL|nr:hypothetical protein PaecuDRAFT_0046 [Paenibacillus curdlanolyticus YK9]
MMNDTTHNKQSRKGKEEPVKRRFRQLALFPEFQEYVDQIKVFKSRSRRRRRW